jgi:hypothetical protein
VEEWLDYIFSRLLDLVIMLDWAVLWWGLGEVGKAIVPFHLRASMYVCFP